MCYLDEYAHAAIVFPMTSLEKVRYIQASTVPSRGFLVLLNLVMALVAESVSKLPQGPFLPVPRGDEG